MPGAAGHSGRVAEAVGVVLVALAPLAVGTLWWLDVIRPGSFARRGLRDVSAWPAWLWGLCAAMMLFSQAAGLGLGARVMGYGDQPAATGTAPPVKREPTLEQRAAEGVGGMLAAGSAGLALLVMLRARTPGPAESHGLEFTPTARAIGIGLIGIGLAFPLVQAASLLAQFLTQVLSGHTPEPIGHETLRIITEQRQSHAAWVLGATAAIGAPIVEELMFRVYVQSTALRLIGRTWPAILITGVLFALIHLGGGVTEWHVLIPLFVLGVGMGVAYERARNVIAPIVMHAVFNIVNLALTVGG